MRPTRKRQKLTGERKYYKLLSFLFRFRIRIRCAWAILLVLLDGGRSRLRWQWSWTPRFSSFNDRQRQPHRSRALTGEGRKEGRKEEPLRSVGRSRYDGRAVISTRRLALSRADGSTKTFATFQVIICISQTVHQLRYARARVTFDPR